MNFPLDLRFKTVAIARQVSVFDAGGQLLWYVKMKSFRLKEAVTIFADRERTRPLFEIRADRVLDISANYRIVDATSHAPVANVQKKGLKALWRAHYEVQRDGRPLFRVREANPWVKVADAMLGDIPVLGFFTGYMFHPTYIATRATDAEDGDGVMRLRKEPAFFEGRFTVDRTAMLSDEEEKILVLALLLVVVLEKRRG